MAWIAGALRLAARRRVPSEAEAPGPASADFSDATNSQYVPLLLRVF
jgi:hypothetical protein